MNPIMQPTEHALLLTLYNKNQTKALQSLHVSHSSSWSNHVPLQTLFKFLILEYKIVDNSKKRAILGY